MQPQMWEEEELPECMQDTIRVLHLLCCNKTTILSPEWRQNKMNRWVCGDNSRYNQKAHWGGEEIFHDIVLIYPFTPTRFFRDCCWPGKLQKWNSFTFQCFSVKIHQKVSTRMASHLLGLQFPGENTGSRGIFISVFPIFTIRKPYPSLLLCSLQCLIQS